MSATGARVLALVGNQRSLGRLENIVRGLGALDVLVLVCGGAAERPPANFPGRVRCLADAIPRDHEFRVLSELRELTNQWYAHPRLRRALTIDGFDLGACARNAFAYQVLERAGVGRIFGLRDIIRDEQPSHIFADPELLPLFEGVGRTDVQLLWPRRTPSRANLRLRVGLWALAGFLYKFLGAALIGRLSMLWTRPSFKERSSVFVGHDHGFKSLEGVLHAAAAHGFTVNWLKPTVRGRAQSRIRAPRGQQVGKVEGLLGIGDMLRGAIGSIRVLLSFTTVLDDPGFRALFVCGEGNLYGFLRPTLIQFFAREVVQAVLYFYATEHLVRRAQPVRVIFSPAYAWCSTVMIQRLRRYGISSVSYAHGMTMEIIPSCSVADISLTIGRFDSEVAKRFSEEREFYYVGASEPPAIKTDRVRDELVIISSNWAIEEKRVFLRESLRFLLSNHTAVANGRVVLKLHPYENAAEVTQLVSSLGFDRRRIEITKDDLELHLRRARTALCLPSTVVLECLRLEVPFFIYDSHLTNAGTFCSELASSIRFSSSDELGRRWEVRPSPRNLRVLWHRYFGPECNPDVVLRALFPADFETGHLPQPSPMSEVS